MKVVILAGGFGTRLGEVTKTEPKPLIRVAGRPILWHVMTIYAAQGVTEFIIALGYRGEVIRRYLTSCLDLAADWRVQLVDTGVNTATGGRMRRLASWVGDRTFMLTYADGLADIDLGELLRFHREHGRLATVTAVHPPARFGALTLEGPTVTRFAEKPQAEEGWINGGFFVLEPSVLARIDDDATGWERGPLQSLAADGELAAFRHEGFWRCVDTQRDLNDLESLSRSSPPPWSLRDQVR